MLAVAGNSGLGAVNATLNIDGVDCRNLNRNSYAEVDADATAGTATLTSRDQTGAPIGNLGGGAPCTGTYGP